MCFADAFLLGPLFWEVGLAHAHSTESQPFTGPQGLSACGLHKVAKVITLQAASRRSFPPHVLVCGLFPRSSSVGPCLRHDLWTLWL